MSSPLVEPGLADFIEDLYAWKNQHVDFHKKKFIDEVINYLEEKYDG